MLVLKEDMPSEHLRQMGAHLVLLQGAAEGAGVGTSRNAALGAHSSALSLEVSPGDSSGRGVPHSSRRANQGPGRGRKQGLGQGPGRITS